MGFAIKSPFDWFMGEPITFYARTQDGRARFEDSGVLVADLEGMGVDFDSESRREVLHTLLKEYGIQFDEEESMFVTNWTPPSRLGAEATNYLAFLNRVQDLLFLNKQRVKSTFKEDLLSAIEERFEGEATISQNESPIAKLPQSTVDILVTFHEGNKLAIFPATSELKAYQAMLFATELANLNISEVHPILVFEDLGHSKLGNNTTARVLNSSLQTAAWSGGKSNVLDKLNMLGNAIH